MLHGSHVGRGWTYPRLNDPYEHYRAAAARGAHVLNEPQSTPDGAQRGYSARDHEGNLWTFALQPFGI